MNKSGVYLATFQIRDLNQIIERDATDTTYKFALLRSVSHVCQRHAPIREENGNVWFPTGYLVEKWLEYYYPIVDSELFIPQKGAEKDLDEPGLKIAFRSLFKTVTEYYKHRGGFNAFWLDYKKSQIPDDINSACLELAKNIWYTIIRYPMKHLGHSVSGEHYTFFNYLKRSVIKKATPFSQELLLDEFGEFSIDSEFYDMLRYFGSYISGEYSILNKWIEFSVKADSSGTVEPGYVYEVLNTRPESERDVDEAKGYYQDLFLERGYLDCVWSGIKVRSWNNIQIDHMIPFSIWQNNDLWNLLPTHRRYNMQKRDLIPSISLLENRKEQIISCWEALAEGFRYRFNKEMEINLLDKKLENLSWDSIFEKLVDKCSFLIEVRGFSDWEVSV